MQTSPKGIAVLELEEGVVLKAYRCPAGRWTIGAGLTAASGVVTPKPGMVISRTEASALLAKALNRNYEPSVRVEMPGAAQHEFDGGVSFHFNTGAIKRASWVKAWRSKAWGAVENGLRAWNKGGGRVLPGLVKRRDREFRMIRFADYGAGAFLHSPPGLARWALILSASEIAETRKGFARLGYEPGDDARGVLIGSVNDFQRDHGLTVDGVIGRATLSTLQRRLDASRKAKVGGSTAGVATAGSATATGTETVTEALPLADWALWIVLALVAVWAVKMAFDYRDVIAAKVQHRAPRMSNWLRSF